MFNRRDFLKTAALGTLALSRPIRVLASRRQTSGHFGLHPFIENHPEAVFIMPTNVDHKLSLRAKFRAGLDFGRNVFVPWDESGIPLNISIPVKLNLKTIGVDNSVNKLENVLGTITDPYFSEGVFEGLKELGISGSQIHVRENPRGNTFGPYGLFEMAERAGIDFRNDFKGTVEDGMEPGRDFNWTEVPNGRWFQKIPHLEPVNNPGTWMLNIAKFKAHGMGLTLCSKNLQGMAVQPFTGFCSPADSDMKLSGLHRRADSIEVIKAGYNRHFTDIPRWDRPGNRGGIWQEAWSHRTLDNVSSTPIGLNVIEGVYGRDGDCANGGPHPFDEDHQSEGSSPGVAKDYMSNMIIFGKDIFRTDIIGHWLGGHEPGNFGYFHLALERGLSTALDPRKIPVYLWENGTATLTPIETFSRTPLLTYYLQRDYNGGIEPEYHLCDEPFDYSVIKGVGELSRPQKPEVFVLYQNRVNPSDPRASIEYRLPISGFVRLEIRDKSGQVLDVPVDGFRLSGSHLALWNTRNHAPGNYSYRLRISGFIKSGDLVLQKM